MESRKYLSGIFNFIGVLSFIAAIVFICMPYQEFIEYGGDAYTGIQNASAHIANILKTFAYCFFIIDGIVFMALAKYNSIKATEEIKNQTTDIPNDANNSHFESSNNHSNPISSEQIHTTEENIENSNDTDNNNSHTDNKRKYLYKFTSNQKIKHTDKDASNSRKTTSRKTWISLALGIIGFACSWYILIIGHIASITGIFIGAKEKVDNNKIIGLIVCMIAETCTWIATFITIF